MREPSESDKETARAAAVEACGRPDLTLLEVEQAGAILLLREPSDKEVLEYVDAATDETRLADAHTTLALRCTVWPSRDTVREIFGRFPLFPSELCGELCHDAGAGKVTKIFLTPKLSVDELEVSGLTVEQGRALLEQYPDRGQLLALAVRTREHTVRLVLKRPSQFALDNLRSAAQRGSGYGQACIDASVECIVWPSEEGAARDILKRWRVLPSYAVAGELIAMGSAGAITRRKKL